MVIMAILQSINGHEPCSLRIQGYLEVGRDGAPRALAHDFINVHQSDWQRSWGRRMDRTRELAGWGSSWGSRKRVTYRHFIISPDPRDDVDLEVLRDLSTEWASCLFGGVDGPGELGSCEVAIVYHDDNESGIPHAHVIVNCLDFETGRALRIDRTQNEKLLPNLLQKLAAERGLSHFDNDARDADKPATRGAFLTKAERALAREGRYSWKADLRARVQTAMRVSETPEAFKAELDALGVDVRPADAAKTALGELSDAVYSLRANPRWESSGYRLGQTYVLGSVERAIEARASAGTAPAPALKGNVNAHVAAEAARTAAELEAVPEAERGVEWRVVATVPESVPIREVARALRANDAHGVRSMEGYERAFEGLATQIANARRKGDDAWERKARAQLNELRAAKALAERGDLFKGVAPQRPPKDRSHPTRPTSFDRRAEERERAGAWGSGNRDRSQERSQARGRDGRAR